MEISKGAKKHIKDIILFSFIITFGIFISSFLFAQDLDSNEPISYDASDLRDPFTTYLPQKSTEAPKEESLQPQVEVKLPEMNIQGIVWQTTNPQVIIDGQVLKLGDTINGAKIIKITKEGISFLYQEKLFDRTSPRYRNFTKHYK